MSSVVNCTDAEFGFQSVHAVMSKDVDIYVVYLAFRVT